MGKPEYPSFANTAKRLCAHRPPETRQCADSLDEVRAHFDDLIERVAPLVPESADAQVAARRIHDACQAVISAIVHNQEAT